MKSNERAMGKWSLFHAVLKNSPTIKTSGLEENLGGQISRTDFYNFLNVYEKEELIVRPTRGLIVLVEKPKGFWNWLKWRRLHNEEKENEEDKRLDLQIREYQCKYRIREALNEYCFKRPFEQNNAPIPLDVVAAIERKWHNHYGLS